MPYFVVNYNIVGLNLYERVPHIPASHQGRRGALIFILQKVQEELGYLPEEAISEIAYFLGQ